MRVVSTTACDDQVMNDLSSVVSSHRWRCVAVKGSCHQTGGKPTNQAFSMPAAGGAIATGQSHGSYCVGEVGGKVALIPECSFPGFQDLAAALPPRSSVQKLNVRVGR